MKTSAYHILRVGMGITFIWVGVLIIRDPIAWGAFIQPWVIDILPTSVEHTMIATAIFDIVVGALMLIDVFTWAAGSLAALHLAGVLAVSGIDAITVRDIGLATGSLALAITDWPHWLHRKKKMPQQ